MAQGPCKTCAHFVLAASRKTFMGEKDPAPDILVQGAVKTGWGECHEDSPKERNVQAERWPPCHESEGCGKYTAGG